MLGYLEQSIVRVFWAVACLSTWYSKNEYIPDSLRTAYCKGILGFAWLSTLIIISLYLKTASIFIPDPMVFRAGTC